MELHKLVKVELKGHKQINEKWIQEQIALDPTILGLGDLVLKDKERIQPTSGRLDLLCQDSESSRRYEIELQLGKTDESHIIRTIEYWDTERKRYPNYDHCAVIIAEDITSRFLNVIQLFNGNIPIIALQMTAYEIGDKVALAFTKVVDELKLGLEEEDESMEVTDKNYWEQKGTKETVKMADDILEIIKEIDCGFELKYNKYYIGLFKNGIANNFIVLRAKKNNIRLEIKLDQSEDIKKLLETNEYDVMDYDSRNARYRIRLVKEEIKQKHDSLKELLELSYKYWNN